VGAWIQAVSSVGILIGGMWAARIHRRGMQKVRKKPFGAPSTPTPPSM
jgi:hypothetical protein